MTLRLLSYLASVGSQQQEYGLLDRLDPSQKPSMYNASLWSETNVSGFELTTGRLSKCPKINCLKWPLLRKSYTPSPGKGVPTKVHGGSKISGSSSVGWSLLVSLGEMDKPWYQSDHGQRTKLVTVRPWASWSKECGGHPEYLSPSKQPVISHQWVTCSSVTL